MRYPNAAKGIKKIYLAEILGIVAAVFGIGILVLTAVRNVDLSAGDPFYVSASGVAAFLMDIAAYVLYLRVLSRAKTMQ